MPGLVPGIHAQKPSPTSEVVCSGAACGRMLRIRLGMAGTSPAMTSRGSAQPNYISDSETFHFPRTALPQGGNIGAGHLASYPAPFLVLVRPAVRRALRT